MLDMVPLEYEYVNGENNAIRQKHEQKGRIFTYCVAIHVLEGAYFVKIDDDTIKISMDNTILIPSYVKHDIWMEQEGRLNYAHFRCRFAQIDLLYLAKRKYILFQDSRTDDFFGNINSSNKLIIQNSLKKSAGIAEIVNAALESVNYDIFDVMSEKWFVDVTSHIDANMDKIIAVNEIIQVSGLSRTALYNKMMQCVKMSPNEFVITRKLKYACELILNGTSVKEVAYSTGYHDESYFSRVFKKHIGVSPTQYKINVNSKWGYD